MSVSCLHKHENYQAQEAQPQIKYMGYSVFTKKAIIFEPSQTK